MPGDEGPSGHAESDPCAAMPTSLVLGTSISVTAGMVFTIGDIQLL
jgi:hypothetical protein